MQNIEEVKNKALRLMKDSGFPVTQDIELKVDDELQIMGYTTEENGKPEIVVAKWALHTDMLIGLLVHELSHIYRNETHHASHNFALHNKAIFTVLEDRKLQPYQEEIIRSILNTIQDLYADDISFKVKKDIQTDPADFFRGWVKGPMQGYSEKAKWTNAGNMISAAFAQSNLERHHMEDTQGKVEKEVQDFLSKSSPEITAKYMYFKNGMVHMPEIITEEAFGELLVEYLGNFLSLIE